MISRLNLSQSTMIVTQVAQSPRGSFQDTCYHIQDKNWNTYQRNWLFDGMMTVVSYCYIPRSPANNPNIAVLSTSHLSSITNRYPRNCPYQLLSHEEASSQQERLGMFLTQANQAKGQTVMNHHQLNHSMWFTIKYRTPTGLYAST